MTPFPSPIGQYIRAKANLAAFMERVFERYYPEMRAARDEARVQLARNLRKPRLDDEAADQRLRGLFDPARPKFREAR